MTQEKEPQSKRASSPFCDYYFHFSLGAGVTPAQGSVKPTAGFTFDKVTCPSLDLVNRGFSLKIRGFTAIFWVRNIPATIRAYD